MGTPARRYLFVLLILSCTRGNRPDNAPMGCAAHPATFVDPLEPVTSRGNDTIKVSSATMGANCGYREGNETERLAQLCDSHRRCDFLFKDGLVPEQWDNKVGNPCQPDYKVAWTCGESSVRYELESVMAEQGDARLRLGCGIVEASPASVLIPEPKTQSPVVGDTTEVRGVVVGDGGMGRAGLKVHLGDRLTLTGPEGEFAFDRVPKIYDVKIASRDGFRATVYLGLSRRDPVLAFTPIDRGASTRHHASVTGVVLSGAGKSPGRSQNDGVWFLSPRALGERTGLYAPTMEGSRYSPINIGWGGSDKVRGVLVALLSNPSGEPWSSAHLAASALSLKDGDAAAVDLRPLPIPSGRIAGRIRAAAGQPAEGKGEKLRFSYVVPGWVGDIDLGECLVTDGTYDCLLPDLSTLNGEYCFRVGEFRQANSALRCGGRIGMKDFSLANSPPPALKVEEIDRKFSWSPAPGVVHLAVGRSFSRLVHVYTTHDSYPFSALAGLGIDLSVNDMRIARLGAEIVGTGIGDIALSWLKPYANMDELASGRGALAMGTTWQMFTTQIDDVILEQPIQWKDKPPAKPFDPLAPDGLSVCSHETVTKAAGAVLLNLIGERVSMRGILTFDGRWGCTLKGCECCNDCFTQWIVTAPDGKGPVLLLQRIEDPHALGLVAEECHRPEPPRIEVVATGRLLFHDLSLTRHRRKIFRLDDVAVCMVKPAP